MSNTARTAKRHQTDSDAPRRQPRPRPRRQGTRAAVVRFALLEA